jgi:hypothetical protein
MDAGRVRRWLLAATAPLAAAALLAAAGAHAGIVHDPSLTWQTLHTPHFAIHFHDGAEQPARRVAAIAERMHERLTQRFQWQPEDRTDIVVTDEYDVTNGNATMFPANRMNLLLAPPDAIEGLEDNDGWLEMLIAHEYTHVLHLDKARGYPNALRSIFGRVISIVPFLNAFPNALQQTWQIEGLAVYHETDRARGAGRGQSSYFDMLMRMEVEGGLKPVAQVNQEVDTWPGGITPYLYGSAYYDFLGETRGPERVQALVNTYSDDFFPFLVNTASKRTFGENINRMWDEFAAHLRAKHQPRLASIRAAGVRAGERLSHAGYHAGPLKALPDGRAYYIAYDGRNEPALMAYRPGQQAPQALAEVHGGARLDVHARAGVLVAQPEVCLSRYYYDLYRYDADSGRRTRLTRCARYRYGAWSPDGNRIAAVHHEMGQSRLEVLSAEGKSQEVWWSGANGEVIADPVWSPDGASLVAGVWRRESGWNIEQFLIGERRWRALTHDAAIDGQPSFSADGKALLFSSDHGGVYNLRRYDLASGEIATLSNVVGGAFYPAAAGAALYYIGYGPAGFDLYRMTEVLASATPRAAAGASAVVEPEPVPLPQLRVTDYEPDTGVRPRWWLPYVVIDRDQAEIGASTAAWDPLYRHIYGGTFAYDLVNASPVGAVSYIYDGWYPTFKLYASRFNNFTRDDDNDVRRLRHEDTYQAEILLPLSRYRHQFALRIAALADEESDGELAAGELPQPDMTDRLFGIGITFDSTRTHPLSVSRSHGREIRLIGEDSDAYGGDYSGRIYTVDWREFFALGGEHVLGIRLAQGWGTDAPRPFRLGGNDTDEALPPLLADAVFASPFNRRDYALRGYPEGRADLEGRRMRVGTLEYRFPIWRVERGAMVPLPIALHQLSGSVFVDSGAVWREGRKPDAYRNGAGAELMTDAGLFYSMRFSLRLGYAHGFDQGGEDQVYLRIGAAF